jgi:hypothetical protein
MTQMTTEQRAELAKEFGAGLIVFGAKRPNSSEPKLTSDSPPASASGEDPAVSLQRAIEQRFEAPSTSENAPG